MSTSINVSSDSTVFGKHKGLYAEIPIVLSDLNGSRRDSGPISEPGSLKNHRQWPFGRQTKENAHRFFRIAEDGWLWENVALVVSIAAILALCATLAIHDGKPTPSLAYGLTLNAVAAFLSVISRVALLTVANAVLHQSKWHSIVQRHGFKKLAELEHFENAASGPWGCLILLFKGRGSWPAWIAAVVTLVSLLFDPFLQQSVQSEMRTVALAEASSSLRYFKPDGYTLLPASNLQIEMALADGIYGGDSGSWRPPCPSGNCTWPEYQQLGFTAKCASKLTDVRIEPNRNNTGFAGMAERIQATWTNITETEITGQWLQPQERPVYSYHVEFSDNSTDTVVGLDLSWMEQATADSGKAFLKTNWTSQVIWPLNLPEVPNSTSRYFGRSFDPSLAMWQQGTFAGVENPLLALGYVHLGWDLERTADGPDAPLTILDAQECALTLSTSMMNTSIVAGDFQNVVAEERIGRITVKQPQGNDWCWYSSDGTDDVPRASMCSMDRVFSLSTAIGLLVDNIIGSIGGQMTFSCPLNADGSISLPECNVPEVTSSFSDPETYLNNQSSWTTLTTASMGSRARDQGFPDLLDGIATSLTNTFYSEGNSTLDGTSYVVSSHVKIEWPWLTLPFVLISATLVAHIGVLIETRMLGLPIWKSSILPYLYSSEGFSLQYSAQTTGVGPKTSEMLSEAEQTSVSLQRDAKGAWGLWSVDDGGAVDRSSR
ncbi:uncharacterized protein HMPREF1541_06312 [Cyphellophora europaea CBS 101466]|uniref:Uncharacterized protein n=1 Tax=Cyphellophora europaea (strain CBS 101466) TaxID=1220924 RepID=W2RP23_CYPE1|nr:uncharacterized protein HMPREF1541_06312 [Cyphellophora europaea CBS 101466]ETN38281.1 hypothetical protein HMPREF1541_06312 [Cyphellophora europaea CBS 101466]